MSKPLRIDFISDIACPWCAVGLASLERALERLGAEVAPELHFHPFELNPHMGPDGQDMTEHLTQKYGSTPQQQAVGRENIRQRGEAVGFSFRPEGRGRIWNTFDAHRLLHWAGLFGCEAQHLLKTALLVAYHGEGRSPADHEVLLSAVQEAGLDEAEAARILQEGRYAEEVRAQEQFWLNQGIHAVPAVVLNNKWLVEGGQPPELFEQAMRQAIAEEGAAAAVPVDGVAADDE